MRNKYKKTKYIALVPILKIICFGTTADVIKGCLCLHNAVRSCLLPEEHRAIFEI